MCFSATASIIAWTIGMLLSIALWFRGRNFDKWNATFLWRVASIQLVEFGIWKTIGNDSANYTTYNRFLTALLLLSLWTQPLAQVSMGYAFTKSHVLLVGTIFYCIVLGYEAWRAAYYSYYTKVSCSAKTPTFFERYKCHLDWKSADGGSFMGHPIMVAIYLFGLFGPLFYQGWRGGVLIAFGILTLALAFVATRSGNALGSLWCFAAVAYGLIALCL